jgi:CBS-domain-containing membrane protein
LQYLPAIDAIDQEPEAVSSAHWGDVPQIDAKSTLLDALLKLLETNASALAIKDSQQDLLGYITLASLNKEITRSHQNSTLPPKIHK